MLLLPNFTLALFNMKNIFEKQQASSGRLISLDAFRGITIALMITVNDAGNWDYVYAPLEHAEWNGVTPTDLVFPFFLYIVGVSIALAYTKRLKMGLPKMDMYKKILYRSLKIFGVGIFLALLTPIMHGFQDFHLSDLRIVGVLQRIAIVFFVCAILFLNTDWKVQAKIGATILVLYYIVMMFVPVPGAGIPMLEPGPDKNIAHWIDSFITPGRLYRGTWDPEGLFSTLPAIVTGITGMLAGTLILSNQSQERKILWLFSLGFLAFVIGGAWDWFFPINKRLWTSSYVMYTSGAASMTLATSLFFVDLLGYKKWTKMGIIFGANAITVYVLAGIFYRIFHMTGIREATFNGMVTIGIEPKLASFIYAILFTLVCYIPIYFMYKKKIFVKL